MPDTHIKSSEASVNSTSLISPSQQVEGGISITISEKEKDIMEIDFRNDQGTTIYMYTIWGENCKAELITAV